MCECLCVLGFLFTSLISPEIIYHSQYFFFLLFSPLLLRIDLFLFLVTCHGCSPPLPSQIARTSRSSQWGLAECRTISDGKRMHRRFVFILSTERVKSFFSLFFNDKACVYLCELQMDFSAAAHPQCNPLGQLRQRSYIYKNRLHKV